MGNGNAKQRRSSKYQDEKMQNTKVASDDLVQEHFGSTIHCCIPGQYLGSKPLHLVNLSPEEQGALVAKQITTIVRAAKAPTPVFLILSDNVFGLVDYVDGNLHVLQSGPLEHLMQLFTSPSHRNVVVYVTHHGRMNISYCHVLQVAADVTDLVVDEIHRHLKITMEATQTGKHIRLSNMDLLLKRDRHVHGVFEGTYCGFAPGARAQGDDVAETAVRTRTQDMKRLKQAGQPIMMIISVDGIRLFEALTEQQILTLAMRAISFVTVVQQKKQTFLVVIENDERLDQRNCHLWITDQALDICRTIGAAMDHGRQLQEAKAGDPFEADGSPEEPVSGPLQAIQIDRERLTCVKILGAGQFGTVYLAVEEAPMEPVVGPDGEVDEEPQRAVKLLRNGASPKDKDEFQREAETLLKMQHPNIVKIVGAAMKQRPWLVVLEMLQYGDLKKVLNTCENKKLVLTLAESALFAAQLADSLAYVMSQGFLHLDVAARNALLHTNNLVKLSDFGMARPMDPATRTFRLVGNMRMAVRWMAPETLGKAPLIFSEKTDVYAFGVMLWEIATYGELPHKSLSAQDTKTRVHEGLSLQRPTNCPDKLHDMMLACWKPNAAERPTFAELHSQLREICAAEAVAGAAPPRDVGAALNALLTQDLRRASKRMSITRQSIKMSALPTPAKAPELATLAEE